MFAKSVSLAAVCAAMLAVSSAQAGAPLVSDGFIVVNADGSKARGTVTFLSSQVRTGFYEIDVDNNIHSCAYSVTEGANDTTTPPVGFATAVGRVENQLAIMVATFDANGAPADRGFHLIVRC